MNRMGVSGWYRPTWVVPDKGPLNSCVCVCACVRACVCKNLLIHLFSCFHERLETSFEIC